MTSSRVVKWFAALGLVGSLLTIVMFILRFATPDGRLGGYFDLTGTVFLLFAVTAIYIVHMKNGGTFGLISLVLALIGTGLCIGVKWVHAFVVPELAVHAPALADQPTTVIIIGQMCSFAIFMIGWVLIGILVAKKRVLSKFSGILLIAAPILDFIPYVNFVAQPLFALTILWVTYQLFKGRGTEYLQEA